MLPASVEILDDSDAYLPHISVPIIGGSIEIESETSEIDKDHTKISHYLAVFDDVLRVVLAHESHLFHENELKLFANYQALSGASRRLFSVTML